MTTKNKMLVFDNPDDFLDFMAFLQDEYNKQHENQADKGDGNK